ncbi:MAG: 2-dehydropantoate 2-reductase [Polyangiaceae bacterium]
MRERVLVVGCGGLGGVVAGTLLEHASHGAPVDLVALTTNATIARAVNANGFAIRGSDGWKTIPGRMTTQLSSDEKFDWMILATQPPQIEEAATRALPHLADDGRMVCLQNGLCEERIAKFVGRDRVVGAVVAWGAAMPEPGVYDRTSSGGFSIGTLDDAENKREMLARLAALLEPVGPVTITNNLSGARWSKLAINCAISTLGTLGGATLGTLMLHRFVRRLALELMTEVVTVARAEKISLEKVSGTLDLDWIALTENEKRAVGSPGLLAKHSMLLAVGARYRRMRSSMLAAIERGRPPAVDFLNGEVVARGKKRQIATPVNLLATNLIWDISRGKRKPGLETLHHFSRATSSSSHEATL